MPLTSHKTIGRLSLYRRLLMELTASGTANVYSHELASMAGVTAAQVRRDLMAIGYCGSPSRGYAVGELSGAIGRFLDDPQGQNIALVGVGNLGRAILAYFSGRRPNLKIVAAFDRDPYKVNRVIHGCRCHPLADLPRVARELDIHMDILAVPSSEAQDVAEALVRAGVNGLLNFAPTSLRVGPHVYVEDIDITTSLEKVAYFARETAMEKEVNS